MVLSVNSSRVAVDLYTPDDSSKHPLLLMLHGSAGIFTAPPDLPPSQDNFGEKRLASTCLIVALPHYLDLLHVKSLTDVAELQGEFPLLLSGVENMLLQLENLPHADRLRVGLYGESYGGFLSVALATRNTDVRAVSEYSGGAPDGFKFTGKAPDFLIQHGEDDSLVPVTESRELKRQVEAAGGNASIYIYPREGHYFSPTAREAILLRSVEFFSREFNDNRSNVAAP
jgi:dienelactone hydrolase